MDDKDLSSGSGLGPVGEGGASAASGSEDQAYDWVRTTTSIRIMSAVIYSLVCVLGVAGNGAVIWATGFRMKKTVATVWYLNLAVPDFLVTAYLPLHVAERSLGVAWPFGRFVCKLDSMLFHMNMYASVFTLTVISVDRLVCAACPVWAQNHRTVGGAFRVSLGVWLLALALSSAYFVLRDTEPFGDEGQVMCIDNYLLVANYANRTAQDKSLHQLRLGTMFVANFVVGFAVPFSVIVSCYSVIIYRIRNKCPPNGGGGGGLQASGRGRSFRIIAAVITAFFLCWLPYHVVRLMYVGLYNRFSESAVLTLVLHLGIPLSHALALLNSCLNPQLYVFSRGFRDVFHTKNLLKLLEKAFTEGSGPTSGSAPGPAPGPASTSAPTCASAPGPTSAPTCASAPGPTSVPTCASAPGPTSVPTCASAPGPTSVPTCASAPGPTSAPTCASAPGPTSVPTCASAPGPTSVPTCASAPGPAPTPGPTSTSAPTCASAPGPTSAPICACAPGPTSTSHQHKLHLQGHHHHHHLSSSGDHPEVTESTSTSVPPGTQDLSADCPV